MGWDELGRNTNLYELDGGMQWQQLENCVLLLRIGLLTLAMLQRTG